MSDQGVDFCVIFHKNVIYISQENILVIKISLKNNPRNQIGLSLSGMNCVSVIQRSDVHEDDIKRLEKIDYDDKTC